MKTVALHNLGRLGNLMFRYAYSRALCEQSGYELRTEPWVGEQVFELDGHRAARPAGHEDIVIDEYRQAQKDMIYTRADCRRWFKLKPEVASRVRGYACTGPDSPFILCHRRVGDYVHCGYPVVSKASYAKSCRKAHLDPGRIEWVTQEEPFRDPYFDGWADFFPDFMRMMYAPILFRGNSTYSWWAHTVSPILQRIFSPVVDGLGAGEHDVEFVEDNYPRFCSLDFVTDLHLKEA